MILGMFYFTFQDNTAYNYFNDQTMSILEICVIIQLIYRKLKEAYHASSFL